MNRRLKFLAALVVSLALTAAPCKDCEPKPVKAQAQNCQHDCCPKPKSQQQDCKWQPADYAAIEARQELQTAPEFGLAAALPADSAEPVATAILSEPPAEAEPPPRYLTHRQLRI